MYATRESFRTEYLMTTVNNTFIDQLPKEKPKSPYSLRDCMMSAFAMFHLKYESLLAFDEHKADDAAPLKGNLKSLYGVEKAPCDSTMRERLDGVSLTPVRKGMKSLIHLLQRSKVLDNWNFKVSRDETLDKRKVVDSYKLISLDGTGVFSSHTVHCDHCLEKHHQDGSITYHHQMLVGSVVNPFEKQIFPIGFEPIIKQDGITKNDCERNATKRWLKNYREDHPNMPTVIVLDGLSSNVPFIRMAKEHRCKFIIVAKEADHKFLYDWFFKADSQDAPEWEVEESKKITKYKFMKDVPLNDSHPDLVNVFYYEERDPKNGSIFRKCIWVTDLVPTKDNITTLIKGAKARWKIENETFNTLKNQGFNFEHNYGHGSKGLSNLLAGLMILAFMVDQICFATNKSFQACFEKLKRMKEMWRQILVFVLSRGCPNWEAIYAAVLKPPPISSLPA